MKAQKCLSPGRKSSMSPAEEGSKAAQALSLHGANSSRLVLGSEKGSCQKVHTHVYDIYI